MYIKKHNLFFPINNKAQKILYLIISLKADRQYKIGCQNEFNFLRTRIYKLVPRNLSICHYSCLKKSYLTGSDMNMTQSKLKEYTILNI